MFGKGCLGIIIVILGVMFVVVIFVVIGIVVIDILGGSIFGRRILFLVFRFNKVLMVGFDDIVVLISVCE